MSAAEGAIRRCDHPGCTATYDAAAVMAGQAGASGWTAYSPRGEHYCFAHQGSPVLAAQRWLRGRHGPDWHTALATQPDPWTRDDLRDFLTCLPVMPGVWRRMAAEVLDVLDGEPAGSVRIERGVEQDDGAGGRHVRGPATPDMPQSFLDDIVRSGIGNPVHVWRMVTSGDWRTGTPPEEGR